MTTIAVFYRKTFVEVACFIHNTVLNSMMTSSYFSIFSSKDSCVLTNVLL